MNIEENYLNRKNMLLNYMTEAGATEKEKRETLLFLNTIKSNNIPQKIPSFFKENKEFNISYFSSGYLFRVLLQNECFYGIATQKNCQTIAQKTKGKKILEVASGRGWLAKGITESGGQIKATDDKSWFTEHEELCEIEHIDAEEAVKKYKNEYDILLISWPDTDDTAFKCIKEWGDKKDIIFIGEIGGCTADHNFAQNFKINETAPYEKISNDIRENIYIGKSTYSKLKKKNKP